MWRIYLVEQCKQWNNLSKKLHTFSQYFSHTEVLTIKVYHKEELLIPPTPNSHYSLLLILCNEFDMAKIKMLHGFEMWGKHFTSEFSVFYAMGWWIAEMLSYCSLLILLRNGLSILKDKADWLINFTLLNYWGSNWSFFFWSGMQELINHNYVSKTSIRINVTGFRETDPNRTLKVMR